MSASPWPNLPILPLLVKEHCKISCFFSFLSRSTNCRYLHLCFPVLSMVPLGTKSLSASFTSEQCSKEPPLSLPSWGRQLGLAWWGQKGEECEKRLFSLQSLYSVRIEMCELIFDCVILDLAQSELAREAFQTLVLIVSHLHDSYICPVINLSSSHW